MENSSAAIVALNLTKKFGDLVAVDNVSFNIHQGEIVGILGPNGAGKTTTIRLLTGIFLLENPSKVEIFGKDITKKSHRYKKNFGIVPEVSNAFSDFTVWQNLKFSGSIHGVPKKLIEDRAMYLLSLFGLTEKKHSRTRSLSKGLKQRLNFCLALLHEPQILIFDEPMSGLDPFSVKLMRNQILQLKKQGKTILITTHDMMEAQNMCDRILIMNKGKIIADESPSDLRERFKPTSAVMFTIHEPLSTSQNKTIIDSFKQVKRKKDSYEISSLDILGDISKLHKISIENKINITNISINKTTLEEVFIHLINKDSKPIQEGQGK